MSKMFMPARNCPERMVTGEARSEFAKASCAMTICRETRAFRKVSPPPMPESREKFAEVRIIGVGGSQLGRRPAFEKEEMFDSHGGFAGVIEPGVNLKRGSLTSEPGHHPRGGGQGQARRGFCSGASFFGSALELVRAAMGRQRCLRWRRLLLRAGPLPDLEPDDPRLQWIKRATRRSNSLQTDSLFLP